MSAFLPKRKKTAGGQRILSSTRPRPPGGNGPNGIAGPSGPSRTPLAASSPAAASPAAMSVDSPQDPLPPGYDPAKVIELPLYSSGDLNGTRYNVMRLNTALDVDPRSIPGPILMNRKPRGGPAMPTIVTDEQGNITGRYVYDNNGKPVLDAEGQHVIEKTITRDHNLVGGDNGGRKRRGKAIKEVYHADIEAVKLRREEADPWVLESGREKEASEPGQPVKMENGTRGEDHKIAEKWVGTLIQPGNMATVLFLDSGAGGFNVVPLGRTYKFDPSRPFTPLDPDAAQKAFEYQAKHKFQNRWEFRQGGPTTAADAVTRVSDARQEERMQRLEMHMRIHNGEDRKPQIKVERFEDDAKREGRQTERGLEGGEDEELDYDVNEEFQDDDDLNTFHRNEEEEEEQKRIEERLKKEFKLANANVGDRPQIEDIDDDDTDDDLFGEKLNDQGRKLRKMMRKRGERPETQYGTDSESDSDSDSDDEEAKAEKTAEKKEDNNKDASKSAPGSAEKNPNRPSMSRESSPSLQRPNQPHSGKAQTAPPVSGAAFMAKRATGGATSPRRHRTGSPVAGRGQSPDGGSVRGSSPVSVRGSSPAPGREGSPVVAPPTNPARGGTTSKMSRKTPTESPKPSTPGTTTSSPGPYNANKRKNSPGDDASRPKKTKRPGSSTPTPGPEDVEPFPGMIHRNEVLEWFKKQQRELVPMGDVIAAFKHRLSATPKDKSAVNQKMFLSHVKGMTRQEENKMLRFQG